MLKSFLGNYVLVLISPFCGKTESSNSAEDLVYRQTRPHSLNYAGIVV